MQPSNRLFGHERTVAGLRKAILGERSMPTWIFGGPMGVGKFTAARLLAGLINQKVSLFLLLLSYCALHVGAWPPCLVATLGEGGRVWARSGLEMGSVFF